MTCVVDVRTGARLHFGLFTTGRSDGGRLGGIGMTVDGPCCHVRARPTAGGCDDVVGPPGAANRVHRFLEQLRASCSSGGRDHFFEIEVLDTIPEHRGFGSGTQLALAVTEATVVANPLWKPSDLTLGRGQRSYVGTIGFREGGFVIDGGPSADRLGIDRAGDREIRQAERPREWLRVSIPPAWRIVLIDPRGTEGTSGAAEENAFQRLHRTPSATEDRLVRIARDSILPGLQSPNFGQFASGVAEFNRLVGEQFAEVQGGVYAHPAVRSLARTLAGTDWSHLAQSSWGPAAAVFCEDPDSADELVAYLGSRRSPADATVTVATPRNRGADVMIADES